MSSWEDPISFLRRIRIARPLKNNLIDRPDLLPLMLIPIGMKLWRSAVRLVSANRRRGYCIAKSLFETNLLVSSAYGTFGLKKAIADDISNQPKCDFKGYKQVNFLFEELMSKAYGDGILDSLSPDVNDYRDTLERQVYNDGLPEYHASMLAPAGRAWLSIRLASILRGELRSVVGASVENTVQFMLENIPYSSSSVEDMHEFFQIWIDHSETQRASKASSQTQQPGFNQSANTTTGPPQQECFLEPEDEELSLKSTAGLRVVALNRNGILHPYGKELSQVRPGRRYKVEDIVRLMHIKMPLYLPRCQILELVGDAGLLS